MRIMYTKTHKKHEANINVLFDIEDCAHMKELRNTLCASVLSQTWVIGMSFIRHCLSFEILIGDRYMKFNTFKSTKCVLIPRNYSGGFLKWTSETESLDQTLSVLGSKKRLIAF